MRLRQIVLATVVLSLVASTPSSFAATKKKKKPKPPPTSCNLMTDDPGDGKNKAVPVIESPYLDITGGDIASGKKTVVGVLKVGSTSTAGDKWAPLGMSVSLNFVILGKTYTFTAKRIGGVEDRHSYTFSAPGSAAVEVSDIKITPNAYRFTIPRTLIADLAKPKIVFENITASSAAGIGNADGAGTQKKYNDKNPSCLKPA